jgi:hypothetical protein
MGWKYIKRKEERNTKKAWKHKKEKKKKVLEFIALRYFSEVPSPSALIILVLSPEN